MHAKRRRGILKHTKGYRWGRKSKIKVAKIAKFKAGQYAYVGRKLKKRLNRGFWQISVNAAARKNGTTYSRLMGALRKNKIELNRKVLAELAVKQPKIFAALCEKVKA